MWFSWHVIDAMCCGAGQDVGRFRMLGATLTQMPGWCSDLKYAAALGTSVWHLWRPSHERIMSLKKAVAGRPVWVAASTHAGEEDAVGVVHKTLKKEWSGLLTFVVPRQPSRCAEVQLVSVQAKVAIPQHPPLIVLHLFHGKQVFWCYFVISLKKAGTLLAGISPPAKAMPLHADCLFMLYFWTRQHDMQLPLKPACNALLCCLQLLEQCHGLSVRLWSRGGEPQQFAGVDVVVVDLIADLPLLYSVSEIAFIGNSLAEGGSGHNLAEAAVAGCAVMVGEHAGHFNQMADELNQVKQQQYSNLRFEQLHPGSWSAGVPS